jgi:tetratricopeptide (TPR) repeat protein
VIVLSIVSAALTVAHAGGQEALEPGLAELDQWILETPRARFYDELDALVEAHEPLPWLAPSDVSTCEGVARDLRAALGPEQHDAALVRDWVTARCGTAGPSEALLAQVPREFQLYAEGVAAMRDGDLDAAGAKWLAVLALPPAERHYRATWAAYMLGNIGWALGGPSERHWKRVQGLARAGSADTLGLAALAGRHDPDPVASLRSELVLLRRDRSSQHTGDRFPAQIRALLDGPAPDLRRAAADPLVAEVVSAWLASIRAENDQRAGRAARWLEAARAAGAVAGGGRLASVAYREGDFAGARRWVERADALDPLAAWTAAKLALMDGDRDAAIAALQRTTGLLGAEGPVPFVGRPSMYCVTVEEDGWRSGTIAGGGRCAHRELGALLLADGQLDEALQAFLAGTSWQDAAFVAERVLTTDELAGFVGRWFRWGGGEAGEDLRHLLARRLAREGRWDEAVPWYPGEVAPNARAVRDGLVQGRDPALPAEARGAALFEAAHGMKVHGWGLLATETAPDFRSVGGGYDLVDAARVRIERSDPPGPFSPSAEELRRLSASRTRPERYQFVYEAYDLAEEAASLLPDQSDALAEVLCSAGTWMRTRDAMRSSQMYYLLLRRAHRTDIGRAARARGGWSRLDEEVGRCAVRPVAATVGSAAEGSRWVGGVWILLAALGALAWRTTAQRRG